MAVYTSSLLVESVFSYFGHFTLTVIKVFPFRIKGADKVVNKSSKSEMFLLQLILHHQIVYYILTKYGEEVKPNCTIKHINMAYNVSLMVDGRLCGSMINMLATSKVITVVL